MAGLSEALGLQTKSAPLLETRPEVFVLFSFISCVFESPAGFCPCKWEGARGQMMKNALLVPPVILVALILTPEPNLSVFFPTPK